MSIHLPNHFGFERLANDQYALTTAFFRAISKIRLQDVIVGLSVMAVVTMTERALDSVSTGFAIEWILLSAVALITFATVGRAIARATIFARAWFAEYFAELRSVRAEVELFTLAKGDRRVMEDIRTARDRQEWRV
jgi:MFS superfamily sulfate permease-like transporter